MKIYFAGSIRGGRDDQDLYKQIIALLSSYGDVLTEHVGDASLTSMGEGGMTDEKIYERDLAWLKACDVVVAEVTRPSLGVGYELGIAEMLGKRILCLFREGEGHKLSAMVGGNARFKVMTYVAVYHNLEEVKEIFMNFFAASE